MASPNSGNVDLPSMLSNSHIDPSKVYEHDVRFEDRNSEEIHNKILEAARVEHNRVRDEALRAIKLNELREEQERAQRERKLEVERLQLERQRVLDEIKKRELEEQARNIPVVPPKAKTPPPVSQPAPPTPQVDAAPTAPPTQVPRRQPQLFTLAPENPQPRKPSGDTTSQNQPAVPVQQTNPFQAAPSQQKTPFQTAPSQQTNPFQTAPATNPLQPAPVPQTNPFQPAPPTPSQPAISPPAPIQQQPAHQSAPPVVPSSEPYVLPHARRYAEIHQELKKLRLAAEAEKNVPGSEIKVKLGELRRKIKKTVGQLRSTGERGANLAPSNEIITLLRESLAIRSKPIDPRAYIVSTPDPHPDSQTPNNGQTLPILFLYLLNTFSKNVVKQLIDEAGAKPETADPIGVLAVSIFSRKEFQWRGVTLIDILIAKMRIACPVLFGFRGNDKTERGRASVGWKKEKNGRWEGEQWHYPRMTGLGAGWAAICLRDFSKSQHKNPWPTTHYWQTIASIVSTPPADMSATQFLVLKALIDNYEKRFIGFYGSAALAVLRVALVDFPSRAPDDIAAALSLKVLADKLNRDTGLQL